MQTVERIAYGDNRQISFTWVPYCSPIGSAISQLDQGFCGFAFPTSNFASASRRLIAATSFSCIYPCFNIKTTPLSTNTSAQLFYNLPRSIYVLLPPNYLYQKENNYNKQIIIRG